MEFTPDLLSIYKKDLIDAIVRRGEANLVTIISRESNFENSLKLVFSNFEHLGDEKALYHGCVKFFTKATPSFYSFLAKNSLFAKYVNTFLSELESKVQQQIDVFSRIIELCNDNDDSFIDLIEKNKENFAIKTILENSDKVPLMYIAVLFLTKENLINSKIKLLNSIFEEKSYSIYALHIALKENSTIISIKNAPSVVNSLFSFTKKHKKERLFCIKALECVRILRFNAGSDELEDVIKANHDEADTSLFPVLHIYPDLAVAKINHLFDHPLDTNNNVPILKAFKKLPKKEQVQIAERESLPDKIISLYSKTQHSGFVNELAQTLKALGSASPCLSSPSWTYFARSVLSIRMLKLSEQYGGPLPSPISKDEKELKDDSSLKMMPQFVQDYKLP